MANEISTSVQLQVTNGNLKFNSQAMSGKTDQVTKNGPSPGAVTATTSGVTVSFASLTLPAEVLMTNTDSTNYVEFGLYDSSTFRPLGEILPGKSCLFRFSRNMLTANTAADVFRLKSNTGNVVVQVNCLDA